MGKKKIRKEMNGKEKKKKRNEWKRKKKKLTKREKEKKEKKKREGREVLSFFYLRNFLWSSGKEWVSLGYNGRMGSAGLVTVSVLTHTGLAC